MGSQVATVFLLTAVFFMIWLGIRSYAQRRVREVGEPGPQASVALSASPITTALLVAPPEPRPPTEDRAAVLRQSRRQALLLRRHVPPRADSLSHFGGVPTVPLGFTWPFVVLPDGRDRALSFVLQVDCSDIPEDGRLGLMPDHGQLYVFLDLDWGTHWVWSVRYEKGDPETFVPARVPDGLPRAYPSQAVWRGPRRDDDWPSLLPSWSFEPVLVPGAETEEGGDEDRYDDGVLVRPDATFPQELHASVHQMMLCPPSYVQGDAEARIGEWLLLLELSSDPPVGHHFGEGVLQFWIRPDDLAARRFDLVELTASAH